MAEDNYKKQTSLRGGTTRQSASLEHTKDRLPHSVRNDEHKTSLRGGTTKQSAQSKTRPLLPKLRFKEFDGEWKKGSLKKIAYTNPKTKELPDKFIYIDLESVTNGILVKEEVISIEEAPSRAQRVLEKNDILYQTVRPYQKNNLYFDKNGDYVASTGYAQIKAKEDSKYLFQFLHTTNFVNIVNRWSTGTSYPAISPSELIKISISYPTLPEQQKIASFLSAVDEKIQQLAQKKSLLEQYKKGVMQQLFSGELRFKDENGEDFPDWEEKRLGEVCLKIQDGNYGASYPKSEEFVEMGIPFLTSKALGEGGSIIAHKIDYISIEKHSELKKAHLALNDILFTNRGANVGAIGYVDSKISNGNIGPQLTLLRVKKQIESRFLFFAMSSYSMRKQIGSQDSGSAMNFFGIGATSKFRLKIPCIKEQQKIANYLSAIDTKIETLNQQIEKTQSFKKGLLQQMFV
ncbi:MAG: restriction endonuclease subunit S [Maribacter litoralis]|uniref:restriction endonuclease subunit S n=1 Tax=Maribacter litoralis TaxID=2059726 RepID=UPI00329A678A